MMIGVVNSRPDADVARRGILLGAALGALPGLVTTRWFAMAASALAAAWVANPCRIRGRALGVGGAEDRRFGVGAYDPRTRRTVLCESTNGPHDCSSSWLVDSWDAGDRCLQSEPVVSLVDHAAWSNRAGPGQSVFWVERMGCSSALVATVTPDRRASDGSQMVIDVEIGGLTGMAAPSDEDAALLAAAMRVLSGRASDAFGRALDAPETKPLTEREREVLELLATGMSVRQVAEQLSRSPHTVHDHVKALHKKLGATSRGQLVSRALTALSPAA